MDQFTREDLQRLLSAPEGTCVSIYMPLHKPMTRENREDSIRLKNMLNEAEKTVGQAATKEIRESIKEAQNLLHDIAFWEHQAEGLALFIQPGFIKYYRLPVAFSEAMFVEDTFYVTPLLSYLNRKNHFYILALSKGSTRLMESVGDHNLQEVEVPDMPKSQDEALWYIEHDQLLTNRASAGDAGSYHGEYNDDSREPKAYLREYLLKVENALHSFFNNHEDPLILCAMEPALGHFKKVAHLDNIAGEIEINPDSLSTAELFKRAMSILEESMDAPIKQAKNMYGSFSANEPQRVEQDLSRIISAAEQGRVDTLLVAKPKAREEANAFHEKIEIDTSPATIVPDEELEAAVQGTLRNSGNVLLVHEDEMPIQGRVAAIMRY